MKYTKYGTRVIDETPFISTNVFLHNPLGLKDQKRQLAYLLEEERKINCKLRLIKHQVHKCRIGLVERRKRILKDRTEKSKDSYGKT